MKPKMSAVGIKGNKQKGKNMMKEKKTKNCMFPCWDLNLHPNFLQRKR